MINDIIEDEFSKFETFPVGVWGAPEPWHLCADDRMREACSDCPSARMIGTDIIRHSQYLVPLYQQEELKHQHLDTDISHPSAVAFKCCVRGDVTLQI